MAPESRATAPVSQIGQSPESSIFDQSESKADVPSGNSKNGFKIYQIPSHITESVEFPEIDKMKEDQPDYEMFEPGQVYDDAFDGDENDTVALIDDDYIGRVI